jgi:hypothetical protein
MSNVNMPQKEDQTANMLTMVKTAYDIYQGSKKEQPKQETPMERRMRLTSEDPNKFKGGV